MTKLGSLENYISFENLNKDLIESQKPYYSMIQRCEELEKILDNFNTIICEEFNINYEKYKNYEYFKMHLDEDIILKEKKFNENYFDLIENEIREDHRKLKEQIKLNKSLTENYLSLLEHRYIINWGWAPTLNSKKIFFCGEILNRHKMYFRKNIEFIFFG
jgi:hypothetical protein